MDPDPAACVVTTVRMPQALPLQPVPESDQESALLGLEPGTGVSVATMAEVAPGGRLEGATTCRVKWLVMVRVAEDCREESAALVAMRVTLGADGRIGGAV